jgi:Ca2+-binding RTX toxin-like protein
MMLFLVDMVMTFLAAANAFFGTAFNNTASGDILLDTFEGVTTGSANDTVYGSAARNKITLGAGNDTVYSLSGDDTLDLGAGNDTAFAGTGIDKIVGGLGNDSINAGDGNDEISFGLGKDSVFAGLGIDKFIIEGLSDSTVANTDVVYDFNSANEFIDVAALGVAASSIVIGNPKTAGISGFNATVAGVFSVDFVTGSTGDLTIANFVGATV